ncbi:MAG: hypothetical protein KGM42_02585 [Hyphomicrobiales bacterium]|nr:hypothetical protein [Hyphomicrobiales bacterium]
MKFLLFPCSAVIGALVLAGCNSTARAPQAAAPQRTAVAQASLPSGAGCSAQIARYRAITDSDHATGNVNDSVWKQIEGEIAGASSACAAGNEAQAEALLRASKNRHGYPG